MNSIKKVALLTVLSTISILGFAQKGTQSPYSVFGLGELNNGQYAYFMGMGNVLTANTDSTIVNQNNPASYPFIARFRPLFQIALNGKFSTFSDASGASSKQRQLGLNQFQMGLPIAKNWGGSFGISPYSSTGYTIVNSNITDGDTISQKINEGGGTVSKFHVGAAYKRKIGGSALVSLGFNFNVLFGANEKIQSFEYYGYPDLALHSRVVDKTRLKGFNYDIGLIYEQKFKRNSLSFGATYSPAALLNANQDVLSFAYSESYYGNFSYNLGISDTVEYVSDNAGKINIPDAFKVGLEYRIYGDPEKGQSYLLKLSTDVKIQSWSNYYEEFNGNKTENIYKDRMDLGFGIQYSPNVGRSANDNLVPWLGKLHYRLGANYTSTELFVNDQQLTDYGMSFGLGIPVTANYSNTNINLGVKYGSLGTTDFNLIKENYLGVYFGITISPGVYDRWFLKRKYD
jgi:hypothetical protein